MNSEIEPMGASFSQAVKKLKAVIAADLPRLALDLILTVFLLGLLLLGALKLWPTVSGTPKPAFSAILFGTLFPFGSLVLLSIIERFFAPAGPRKSLRSWLLHLQITAFFSFITGFASIISTVLAAALAHRFGFDLGLIDLRFAGGKGIIALLGAVWVSAVAIDFFFYWQHRLAHKVPLLWQLHKLHHMDPELDVVTLFRGSWLDTFYLAIAWGLPMGIFLKLDNLDPWELGLLNGSVVAVFSTLLNLGHMNVRFQVGKAASLFYCSPQIHRIHHSRLPRHFDKNFAFNFPLWDVLFGTYYAPARDEFPPTGVPGEKEIKSVWEAQIFPLREWLKMFRAWRQRKASQS